MERTDHCIEELKSWKVLSTAIHWLSSVGPDASILSWISFICKKKVETKVYILSASFSFQLLHDPKSFSSSKFDVYSVLWLFCYFQVTSSFQVLLTSFRIDGKNNWNVFIFSCVQCITHQSVYNESFFYYSTEVVVATQFIAFSEKFTSFRQCLSSLSFLAYSGSRKVLFLSTVDLMFQAALSVFHSVFEVHHFHLSNRHFASAVFSFRCLSKC